MRNYYTTEINKAVKAANEALKQHEGKDDLKDINHYYALRNLAKITKELFEGYSEFSAHAQKMKG